MNRGSTILASLLVLTWIVGSTVIDRQIEIIADLRKQLEKPAAPQAQLSEVGAFLVPRMSDATGWSKNGRGQMEHGNLVLHHDCRSILLDGEAIHGVLTAEDWRVVRPLMDAVWDRQYQMERQAARRKVLEAIKKEEQK